MPPGAMPGAPWGSGLSPTIASVVINSPATDAASCSATRTTLVGSIIPAATLSLYSPDRASTHHDRPLDTGSLRDLTHWRLDGLPDNLDTDLLVVVGGVEAGQNLARK